MPASGQKVILLGNGMGLTASGAAAAGQGGVLYSDSIFRGSSGAVASGQQVLLVADGVAQAAAGPEGVVIIDNFEAGNLNAYNFQGDGSGSFTRSEAWGLSTSTVYDGTYSLYGKVNDTGLVSMPGGGLSYYPNRGDKMEWYGWLGSGGQYGIEFGFGVQNLAEDSSEENWYETAMINHDNNSGPGGSGGTHIGKRKNGTWEHQVRAGPGYPTGEWIKGVVEWGDPTISFTGYTQDSNGDFTNQVASVSFDDTEWDDGGVEWNTSQSSTDDVTVYADLAQQVGEV